MKTSLFERKTMKAYKAFNKDLTCRGFQYKEGETFEHLGDFSVCNSGFHFCKDLALTLEYYPQAIITKNAYAEVEILGEIKYQDATKHKGSTNRIKIVKVFTDEEILKIFDKKNNSGEWNSGNSNSVNNESGMFNSLQSKYIIVFNKDCLIKKWENADKPNFLYFDLIAGKTYKESFQESFKSASENDIKLLKKLPNFDAKVFYKISGIKIK